MTPWQNAFDIIADCVGLGYVPAAIDASGMLPGFNHNVAHWFVAYGYQGFSTTSPSDKTEVILYFDSSQEHPGQYWFSQSVYSLEGDNMYGVVG